MQNIPTDLSQQTVIVTGASSGIGEATARALVENGAQVMLAARREGRLKELGELFQMTLGLFKCIYSRR